MLKNKIKNKQLIHKSFLFFYSSIIFISIIKFGIPTGINEANSFPMNIAEWIIFSWPSYLFPLVTVLLLLITLAYSTFNSGSKNIDPTFLFQSLWILFTISSLLGIIHATCFDFPLMYCFYFSGITAFSISLFYLGKLYGNKDIREYLLTAIFYASLLIVLYGLYQYFYGFEETRDYIFSIENKAAINSIFYTRLMQNYVYSTFSLTNTLGGFITLTMPIAIWYSITHTSKAILKYIIPCFIFIIYFSVLLLSGSRSAIVVEILIILIIILTPLSKKFKIPAILTAFFVIPSAIYFYLLKGISSASLSVRFDYFTVALKLFWNNIITGCGWGNFFFFYGFMKKYPSSEASHTPHNFILSVASQSGIFPAIFIICIFLIPIILLTKKLLKNHNNLFTNYNFYLLIGIISIFAHMLLDIDFQVPSIIMTSTIFCVLSIPYTKTLTNTDKSNVKINFYKYKIIFITALILAAILSFASFKIALAQYKQQKLYSLCFPMPEISLHNKKKQDLEIKIKNALNSSVKVQPYSPQPWSIAGNYFLQNRMWKNAEFCFISAIQRSPNRASYYYNLFICQLNQKKIKWALENFRKAKTLFPNLYGRKYNDFIKRIKKVSYVQ